jgi:hypothetical protein
MSLSANGTIAIGSQPFEGDVNASCEFPEENCNRNVLIASGSVVLASFFSGKTHVRSKGRLGSLISSQRLVFPNC